MAWKQAWWPPLFTAFLISPCPVTTIHEVSSEIYSWRVLLLGKEKVWVTHEWRSHMGTQAKLTSPSWSWWVLVLLFARYTKTSAVAIFWDENSFRPRYSSCCSCGAFRVTSLRLVQQMLTKRFELGPVATVFTDLKCWPFGFAADIADLTLNG